MASEEQHIQNNDQVESVPDGIWIRGSNADWVSKLTLSVQVIEGLDKDQPERLRKEQHIQNNDQVESVPDGIWIRGSHTDWVSKLTLSVQVTEGLDEEHPE